jgi:hypothetical protein
MKNFMKIISAGFIFVVIITGCVQPQTPYTFNPNNKGIIFVDGKPYYVPYGTQNRTVTDKFIKMVGNKMGCKRNSVWWIDDNLVKEFQKMQNVDFNSLILQAARKGRTGCTPPLSDKEYQYYMHREQQMAENARAIAYYNAATAPKRSYNYNYVTGSVFHYGY